MDTESMKSKITEILSAIKSADTEGILERPDASVLDGFSGEKFIGALQRLTKLVGPRDCYVEVGVFQGLTLLSTALANPTTNCFGIDNFAFFDIGNKNLGIVEDRAKRLNINNYTIINQDFEPALLSLMQHIDGNRVGVYLIDGPHDYRSQLMCLEMAKNAMSETGVIIVDDSNYNHVRQANRDFLVLNQDYKLVFESYTPCHPFNMSVDQLQAARQGWWDGINIIVRDPSDCLERIYPQTCIERTVFNNDNDIHSARYREIGASVLYAYQSLFDWPKLPKNFARLARDHWNKRRLMADRHFALNMVAHEPSKARIASLRT